MNIEQIDIDKVIPYHNNPRKNQAVDKVASSLSEFGFQQPIVVDKNYVVIVGHTRLQAAKKLNYQKVPVFIADLSDAKSKAYRIADNRLHEDSSWDYDFLNIEMNMLNEINYDLGKLCFNEGEIKNLLTNETDFAPSDLDDQSDIDDPAERCETCGQTLPK